RSLAGFRAARHVQRPFPALGSFARLRGNDSFSFPSLMGSGGKSVRSFFLSDKMKTGKLLRLLGLALVGIPALAIAATGLPSGEIVFEETFDKQSPGIIGKPWSVSGGEGNAFRVAIDSENRFGRGASNRVFEYGKVEAAGSAAAILANAFSAELAMIRFQYFQPDDGIDGYSWMIFYAGNRGTGNRAQVVTIGRDGSLAGSGASYERGRVYDVMLVVNNSSRPTAYGDNFVVQEGQ